MKVSSYQRVTCCRLFIRILSLFTTDTESSTEGKETDWYSYMNFVFHLADWPKLKRKNKYSPTAITSFKANQIFCYPDQGIHTNACLHSHTHSYGWFKVANSALTKMHVFGLCKEARVLGENPRWHWEHMQTPQRKAPISRGFKPRTVFLWRDSAHPSVSVWVNDEWCNGLVTCPRSLPVSLTSNSSEQVQLPLLLSLGIRSS